MTEVIEINGGDTIVIEDQTVEIIEAGAQGPAGPPGGGITEVDHGTIISGNTDVVDSIGDTNRCVMWLVCAGITGGKHTAFTVQASHDGSVANFSVFGKVVSPSLPPLSLTIDVDLFGGAVRLKITNNEAVGVVVSLKRIEVSP